MKADQTPSQDDDTKHVLQERGADGAEAGVEQEGEEELTYPFDPEQISISSQIVPLSYLIERINDNSISSPPIQRGKNLWTPTQQSRLIESLMLKIPLPLFYVSIDKEEHWSIVDGLQRISAIRNYIVNKSFQLTGLEFLKNECDNLIYSSLPAKYQKRIKETQLQFATINATTPLAVQRTIFKRLNTGGLPLSAQEIRHALHFGNSALLLEKLSKTDEFTQATTFSINDSRMAARELILRFTAFLVRGVKAYPRNDDMDEFLCETMQFMNAMPDCSKARLQKEFYKLPDNIDCKYTNLEIIEEKFILAMKRARDLLGENAFRKSTSYQTYRTPVNKALFETTSVILAEMSESDFNIVLSKKSQLSTMLNLLFNADPKFSLFISKDSLKFHSVNHRFDLLKKVFTTLLQAES
ncbi:DUF262 domain-containing protein [Desulfovibrio litoralis]|uniref:GmrSD restriction endonucleases N-terminal domain-containing protein n=1 Tax=Desulfovibrio litoralis DSM 11393 TaxID=1121455 RepID=A0A1M7TH80_9BACT|nr:DUF262 domain-containing protein [Desulfovibrio litoralis]SHN70065.1 Protein of unknown function DUF262 [Desulfovibrio litoralis DSM 11393]